MLGPFAGRVSPAGVCGAHAPAGRSTGYLPHSEAARLLGKLAAATPRQLRFILAFLRSLDVAADGSLSYYQLRQARHLRCRSDAYLMQSDAGQMPIQIRCRSDAHLMNIQCRC